MIDRTAQDVIRAYKRGRKAALRLDLLAFAMVMKSAATSDGRWAAIAGWNAGADRLSALREAPLPGRKSRRHRFRPRWQKPHYNRAWNNPRARG